MNGNKADLVLFGKWRCADLFSLFATTTCLVLAGRLLLTLLHKDLNGVPGKGEAALPSHYARTIALSTKAAIQLRGKI